MGENRWHGIIAVVVIVALATFFFAGYVFVTLGNAVELSGTQESIVGCTFEYRITGNYDDDYYYSGTETQKITGADSTTFNITTKVELYKSSVKTGTLELLEYGETESRVYRTELSSPGKYIDKGTLNTYWGVQNIRQYTKTVDGAATTTYVGYELVTMEKYVEYGGDSLKIYQLVDTDYILDKKVNNFGTYATTMTTYGSITEKTVMTVSGSTQVKQVDTTGTCYKKSFKETFSSGTEKKQSSYTKWVIRSEDKQNYGYHVGTDVVTFTWGKVECELYQYEEGGLTTLSYVYGDKLLLKSKVTGVSEGSKYDLIKNVTELIMDNTAVNSVEKLNELCSMM